jgi:predicted CXXCH cytochrome family protein
VSRLRPGRLAALGALALALVAGAPAGPGPAAAAEPPAESCVTCHLAIGDERLTAPIKAFAGDVHATRGFGCAACHGGDPREPGMEAMDPAKGYVGVPRRQQVVQVCGRCHADARFMKQYNPNLRVDQVAEYATSVHGRRLREAGDAKVAVCSSCHAAHAIRPASDPKSSVHPLRVAETCGRCHGDPTYMAPYKIPTDQVARYRTSVHWAVMSRGDLSAPTCNDCHGNHGAAPPGISWVGNVCGQCHTVMADLFARSRHAQVFAQMGVPGCATCHDNHAILPAGDELLGLGAGAVCAGCHTAEDGGGKVAAGARALVDSLGGEIARARAILAQAEHAGMEVSQAQFDLNGATDALIKARASVHAFSLDAVKKEVEPGLAIGAKAHARGVRALEELGFRRRGLVVSVAIILALIGGIVLKIRQLERPAAGPEPPRPEETP